jgi:hypothetical protein
MEEKTPVAAPPKPESGAYPNFQIKNNVNPSRLLNFPILGPIIKIVLLIPVFLWMWLLAFGFVFFWIITPFVILFTGRYWDAAYKFNLGYLKLAIKMNAFFYGLTDKYPGFSRSEDGLFTITVNKPEHPNRILAFPLLGIIIRVVLLIPYMIWLQILGQGTNVAYFIATFAILFKKKYPESLYEFVRDDISRGMATNVYTAYLSDTYPSFKISMNHKNVKILLIIAGALLTFANIITQPSSDDYEQDLQDSMQNESMYDSTQDATDVYSDF